MKKIIILALTLLSINISYSQSYDGKGDSKISISYNVFSNASGPMIIFETGMSNIISYGYELGYLTSAPTIAKPALKNGYPNYTDESEYQYSFLERARMKFRLAAHLGKTLKLGDKLDVYPGLKAGFGGIGGFLGAKYFIKDSFGFVIEAENQFANFDTFTNLIDAPIPRANLFSGFGFQAGISFNL